MRRQRDVAYDLITAIPGVTCVKPKATLYMFPRLDPKIYPIKNDQTFITELLQEEKVLLVQGTGFNWPHPDHFRLAIFGVDWANTSTLNNILSDMNDDNVVDLTDFSILASAYGN